MRIRENLPDDQKRGLFARFLSFWHENQGGTAVEYALMVGVLSSIMLASIQSLGSASAGTLAQVAQTLEAMEDAREQAPQQMTLEAPAIISIPISAP